MFAKGTNSLISGARPSVRFLTEMPAKTDPIEVAVIVITALLLSFLATIYPALRGAATEPAEALRYE